MSAGTATQANSLSALHGRDQATRSQFSPFIPKGNQVSMPFEMLRVELHPQSAINSNVEQPIRFTLPRHGILANLEIEAQMHLEGTTGEVFQWAPGVAQNWLEYVELVNAQGFSIGRVHGETWGFFDPMSGRFSNEETHHRKDEHGLVGDTERARSEVLTSGKTLDETFSFRCPLWCFQKATKALPLQCCAGDTVLQLQCRDLKNLVDKTAIAEGLAANTALTAQYGTLGVKLWATYYILPLEHNEIYRSAMLQYREWPCNDEQRQIVTPKGTGNWVDSSTVHEFKLDAISGLATEIMFVVYKTADKTPGANVWPNKCLKLDDIELRGSGRSLLGAKIQHKQLKTRIQKRQYGYCHDDANGDTLDVDCVYIFSFSMSPSEPSLNHGTLSLSNVHNLELYCKISDGDGTVSGGDAIEMLFMSRNRAFVTTTPRPNGTISISKIVES